jgi:hypothetical protein
MVSLQSQARTFKMDPACSGSGRCLGSQSSEFQAILHHVMGGDFADNRHEGRGRGTSILFTWVCMGLSFLHINLLHSKAHTHKVWKTNSAADKCVYPSYKASRVKTKVLGGS